MKKITSMFLALVMALALTIPAFASSGTVKVEGSIQVPTLNVVLPTTASMVMNPYNMSVKLDPRDPASAVNDQIISPTMEVKNLSNIGVQVGIKVTGTKGRGDVEFATGSAASSSTKEAYVYVAFEIGNTGLDVADTNGSGNSTVVLSDTEQDVADFLSTAVASNANTLAASADGKAPLPTAFWASNSSVIPPLLPPGLTRTPWLRPSPSPSPRLLMIPLLPLPLLPVLPLR